VKGISRAWLSCQHSLDYSNYNRGGKLFLAGNKFGLIGPVKVPKNLNLTLDRLVNNTFSKEAFADLISIFDLSNLLRQLLKCLNVERARNSFK